jgi:hypothetical protein
VLVVYILLTRFLSALLLRVLYVPVATRTRLSIGSLLDISAFHPIQRYLLDRILRHSGFAFLVESDRKSESLYSCYSMFGVH